MNRVRVLIVDDQLPFRRAAAAVVDETEPFELVGSVGSAEDCLAVLEDLRPDLVLMDVNLPGMDGITAAGLLAARGSSPAVVLVSTYPSAEFGDRGQPGGPVYLEKSQFDGAALATAWAGSVGGSGSSGNTAVSDTESAGPGSN